MLAAEKMPRREIFLLTVKGERARPGLTAALAETMGKHDVTVLDIGQAGQPHCSPRSLTCGSQQLRTCWQGGALTALPLQKFTTCSRSVC